jgi:predicted enzyme related to lactoylglutathione lyase
VPRNRARFRSTSCTVTGLAMARSLAPPLAAARHTSPMTVSLHHIVIDAHDLPGLARFWSEVLGWKILSEREREVVIGPAVDAPVGICLMPAGEAKSVKNRVHLDLNPGADVGPEERAAEIARILSLGAQHVDIGQTGDESWTVLADPEGNELCILRPKRTLID